MSQIILKGIGRGKYNGTVEVNNPEVAGKKRYDENDLAEMAYREVKKHLASREVELSPNDEKGEGHWKVYVGFGSHVGDVQIIV